MSLSKSYFWDQAEKKLDTIVEQIETGLLTQSQAIKTIIDADEAWGLLGFDSVNDVTDFITDIKVKNSC
jgi:hypothetical protein